MYNYFSNDVSIVLRDGCKPFRWIASENLTHLLEHNWRLYQRMELENTLTNATSVTGRTAISATGSTKKGATVRKWERTK